MPKHLKSQKETTITIPRLWIALGKIFLLTENGPDMLKSLLEENDPAFRAYFDAIINTIKHDNSHPEFHRLKNLVLKFAASIPEAPTENSETFLRSFSQIFHPDHPDNIKFDELIKKAQFEKSEIKHLLIESFHSSEHKTYERSLFR